MTTFLDAEGAPRANVVVSSSRSGSNLLVRYLRQVPDAAAFGEIFREDFPDIDAWAQLSKRLGLGAEASALHRSDVTAFWELVLSRILARKRLVSAKIFYYHRRDDAIWQRFAEPDHRVIHLWRDSTFDQYVSRLQAVASGEWKGASAGAGGERAKVQFDRDDYLEFRATRRRDIEATRQHFGGSERYVEIEYAQLTEPGFMEPTIASLFGVSVELKERLERQMPLPKLEYVDDADAAAPYAADSIRGGFAIDA